MRRISFLNPSERSGATGKNWARNRFIWAALTAAVLVPIAAAMTSPLLAWRDPVYIAGGFSGVLALALLLTQPLLAAGYLPSLSRRHSRHVHRWVGGSLVLAVVTHVTALWITSPPDVVDALLFVSPTPFSAWGVIAMWALFAAALLAVVRRRFRMSPDVWRRIHAALAAVVVVGSVIHALLIEGTMETISKAALCLLVLAASAKAFVDLKVWAAKKSL